jgi:hypothetical protein
VKSVWSGVDDRRRRRRFLPQGSEKDSGIDDDAEHPWLDCGHHEVEGGEEELLVPSD